MDNIDPEYLLALYWQTCMELDPLLRPIEDKVPEGDWEYGEITGIRAAIQRLPETA